MRASVTKFSYFRFQERVVGLGGLFHFRRFLHQRYGLAVAMERAIAPSGCHLELNCDLPRPVQIFCVRQRLL